MGIAAQSHTWFHATMQETMESIMPTTNESAGKVARYRERMRAAGLRPV
jgi:hypothetical protein